MRLIPVIIIAFGIAACSYAGKKPAPAAKPLAKTQKSVAAVPKSPTGAPRAATPAKAGQPKPVLEPVAKARLGKFDVSAYALGKNGDEFRLAVEHDGNSIAQTGETYRTVKTALKKDIPTSAETVVVEVFTGGANCCLGYYLLTSLNGKEAAAFIDPRDSALAEATDVGEGKSRTFTLTDPSFMYYTQGTVSLNRPESPRLERFIVFENGAWRVDTRGEYAAAYKALARKVKTNKEGNPTANAISFAYYSLMAGTEKSAVAKAFNVMLPQDQSSLASAMFADVEKAVDSFTPLKIIRLQ